MKKMFYLMALLAITPLSFTSCSSDDDDDNNEQKPKEITLNTPAHKDDAVKFALPTPKEATVKNKKVLLYSLELTESGQYLLAFDEHAAARQTRATAPLSYLMGTYSKLADGSFQLNDFARLVVTHEGSTYVITLIPTGGEGIDYEVVKTNNIGGSEMTNYLCRTWTVTNTRLRGTINGANVAKDFKGTLNVNDIMAYAKSKGANISEELAANTIVDGVTFTSSSTYAINYKNGKYDVGTWNWVKQETGTGEISYKWNDKSMGNSLENGQAYITLEGNNCKLTLPAKVSGSNIEMVCTMQ
jgi:hypothetical protein